MKLTIFSVSLEIFGISVYRNVFFFIYFIFQRNNKHGNIIILLTWYGRGYRLLTFVFFWFRRVEAQRLAEPRPYGIKSEIWLPVLFVPVSIFHISFCASYGIQTHTCRKSII